MYDDRRSQRERNVNLLVHTVLLNDWEGGGSDWLFSRTSSRPGEYKYEYIGTNNE
jgi:hypothetical protein